MWAIECLALFQIPPWASGREKREAWSCSHRVNVKWASHASLIPDCNVGLSVCPSMAPGTLPGTLTVLSAAEINVSLLNEKKENKACGHYRHPQPLGLRNFGTN